MNEPEKMELWKYAFETDPAHTKEVDYKYKFTAIDAYYQIQKVTEMFGPCGKGWWYEVGEEKIIGEHLSLPIKLYYKGCDHPIPVFGSCMKAKGDVDCLKKALTNGLTKAFSYLGVSGDVFMGKFDDVDYVNAMNKKVADEKGQTETLAILDEPLLDLSAMTGKDCVIYGNKLAEVFGYQAGVNAYFKMRSGFQNWDDINKNVTHVRRAVSRLYQTASIWQEIKGTLKPQAIEKLKESFEQEVADSKTDTSEPVLSMVGASVEMLEAELTKIKGEDV